MLWCLTLLSTLFQSYCGGSNHNRKMVLYGRKKRIIIKPLFISNVFPHHYSNASLSAFLGMGKI
jgi:hypothetical protein